VLSLGLGSTHQLLGVVAWRIQRLRDSIIFYRALITVVDMRFVINSTIEKGLTAHKKSNPSQHHCGGSGRDRPPCSGEHVPLSFFSTSIA